MPQTGGGAPRTQSDSPVFLGAGQDIPGEPASPLAAKPMTIEDGREALRRAAERSFDLPRILHE